VENILQGFIFSQGFGDQGHFLLCTNQPIHRLAQFMTTLLEVLCEMVAHFVGQRKLVAHFALHQSVPTGSLEMILYLVHGQDFGATGMRAEFHKMFLS
jgi:hypothetical protein